MSKEESTGAEIELAGFFAKYEPAIARLGKALRAKLRVRLPGLSEVVYFYENQDALVIAYSPTGKGYQGLCTLALYPETVKLFFARGAALSKADPNGLLRGRGTVRFVVLDAAADLDRPEIEALIAAAVELAKVRLVAGAKGAVILQAASQKQRAAQRAKKAARPAAATRKTKTRR
jgi:hypothetical protein